jgi:hypothetical protein
MQRSAVCSSTQGAAGFAAAHMLPRLLALWVLGLRRACTSEASVDGGRRVPRAAPPSEIVACTCAACVRALRPSSRWTLETQCWRRPARGPRRPRSPSPSGCAVAPEAGRTPTRRAPHAWWWRARAASRPERCHRLPRRAAILHPPEGAAQAQAAVLLHSRARSDHLSSCASPALRLTRRLRWMLKSQGVARALASHGRIAAAAGSSREAAATSGPNSGLGAV